MDKILESNRPMSLSAQMLYSLMLVTRKSDADTIVVRT